MLLDCIYQCWNKDAKKRYELAVQNNIIAQNKQIQLKRFLKNHQITMDDFNQVKQQMQINCNCTDDDVMTSISQLYNLGLLRDYDPPLSIKKTVPVFITSIHPRVHE
jgi:hypothetical protein